MVPVRIIPIVIVLVLSACGGGGEDENATAAWCDTVERMADFLESNQADATTNSMEELESVFVRVQEFQADLVAQAPAEIGEEVEALFASESEPRSNFDEPDPREESRAKVNEFVREECQLEVSL